MDVPILGPLPHYFSIGLEEKAAVFDSLRRPLSGYLGGIPHGGYWVERLSENWCKTFRVKHAVPCNSATSGLLAACMAVGIGPGDLVWTTVYSMSATAACAKVLGATLAFIDIETTRFSLDISMAPSGAIPKCIIVTNLWGHPAHLMHIRSWCDCNKVTLIEDNAQSPFATEHGQYAGTIGHIGVFSLNVHKHIQSGEGGVIVTHDDALADRLRGAINHGELGAFDQIGLNLRITEPVAAIADVQLKRGASLVASRIELAEELTDMFPVVPWIIPPKADRDCTHVYYIWAARVLEGKRDALLQRFQECQFPIRKGYSPTLNRIFGANNLCSIAERMEDEELITFEVCAYDPTSQQRAQMQEAILYAVGE